MSDDTPTPRLTAQEVADIEAAARRLEQRGDLFNLHALRLIEEVRLLTKERDEAREQVQSALQAGIDTEMGLHARCAALESQLVAAQQEAATVRRAYLHEKARADDAAAPESHAYSGPVSAERVEASLRSENDSLARKLAAAEEILLRASAASNPIRHVEAVSAALAAIREIC